MGWIQSWEKENASKALCDAAPSFSSCQAQHPPSSNRFFSGCRNTRQRDGDGTSSLMDHSRVCICMCVLCAGARGHRVGDVKAGRSPCLLSLTFVVLPILGSPIPRDFPSPHSWDIPRDHGPPNSPCSPLILWKDFSFNHCVLRVKCYSHKTSYIPVMEAEEGGSRNSRFLPAYILNSRLSWDRDPGGGKGKKSQY